ncbi:spore coat polysaccharide biosynthesis protein SpsF [Azospirillum agricola]|uniref:cytidylyltransferase domain-containing protein n=1 Tax=Azospirillum agricola TaxID=1720247 RepID=UPI001AE81B7C|nr:glycosyltransferase family protein [Azospirillum agricola]MBP2233303.1 spore coat polysaccharide biosynthesis protein SpsF [Azospirillum agricola]
MAGVGVILQARMGSTRLPGKVLRPLAGVPMLGRILDRLGRCRAVDRLVVATSDRPADDAVAAFVADRGVGLFRGSETDVLDRYHQCAAAFGFDVVVRATGDNPFVDPEEGDRLIAFLFEQALDYACAFPDFGSGLPVGVGLEVMTAEALSRSWRHGRDANHREHVNEYIQERPGLFRQAVPDTPPDKRAPGLRLTVDTPEDFRRAETLHAAYGAERGEGEPDTPWLVAAARTRGWVS